jgi:hypothetical protein
MKSRKMSLATTDKAIAAAACYCRKFVNLGDTPVIYTDESYINQYRAAKFAVSSRMPPTPQLCPMEQEKESICVSRQRSHLTLGSSEIVAGFFAPTNQKQRRKIIMLHSTTQNF